MATIVHRHILCIIIIHCRALHRCSGTVLPCLSPPDRLRKSALSHIPWLETHLSLSIRIARLLSTYSQPTCHAARLCQGYLSLGKNRGSSSSCPVLYPVAARNILARARCCRSNLWGFIADAFSLLLFKRDPHFAPPPPAPLFSPCLQARLSRFTTQRPPTQMVPIWLLIRVS